MSRKRENTNASDSLRQYLKSFKRFPLLTRDEEKDYATRAKSGDAEARKVMIERNLRLVMSIALTYKNRGMELLDLIQEGNLGLIDAVKKFDPERNNRFSTFATWMIRKNIQEALRKRHMVVLPRESIQEIKGLLEAKKQLKKETGSDPNRKEISRKMGITEKKVEAILKKIPLFRSSDTDGGNHCDVSVLEILPDETLTASDITLDKEKMSRVISKVLQKISDEQRETLVFYFGLYGGDEQTLTKIAKAAGISHQAVTGRKDRGLGNLLGILQEEGYSKSDARFE